MNEETMQQAREIHHTVGMLRDLLARNYTRGARATAPNLPCADLTFPQSNALMVIQQEDEMTMKELATALSVSPPSASAMADRLVEMGMLTREQSRQDRRAVRVKLSKEGAKTFAAMENQILQVITELLDKLGPDYALQWCEVYARIREIITKEKEALQRGPVEPGEAV